MTGDEMIDAVSTTAFVDKEDCRRVVTSYHRVIENEIKKQVKKYVMLTGSILAFLSILALSSFWCGTRVGKRSSK